jgi:hypothetical protein
MFARWTPWVLKIFCQNSKFLERSQAGTIGPSPRGLRPPDPPCPGPPAPVASILVVAKTLWWRSLCGGQIAVFPRLAVANLYRIAAYFISHCCLPRSGGDVAAVAKPYPNPWLFFVGMALWWLIRCGG